tara:strand:- start:259 stop:693 length:435 start_codon:yes stop_codon:yes gene_type:complete
VNNQFIEDFYEYIQDNAQLIAKSIVKISAKRHTPEYKNHKTDWDWIEPNKYYLITNDSSIFLIKDYANLIKEARRFCYVKVATHTHPVMLETWWQERLLNLPPHLNGSIGFWSFSNNVWAMGYVIDLSNQVNKFMNWTSNPLED